MKLAADASAVVAESLRLRGEQLIAHPDLSLCVAAPTWSEIELEVTRRIDALVQHGRLTSARRDDVLRDRLAFLARVTSP